MAESGVAVNKRGRPRTYQGKMTVTIGVRVPADMADELFILAHRRSMDLSVLTRAALERLLRRERILLSENCKADSVIQELVTS